MMATWIPIPTAFRPTFRTSSRACARGRHETVSLCAVGVLHSADTFEELHAVYRRISFSGADDSVVMRPSPITPVGAVRELPARRAAEAPESSPPDLGGVGRGIGMVAACEMSGRLNRRSL
jgi:hypothetical protein